MMFDATNVDPGVLLAYIFSTISLSMGLALLKSRLQNSEFFNMLCTGMFLSTSVICILPAVRVDSFHLGFLTLIWAFMAGRRSFSCHFV